MWHGGSVPPPVSLVIGDDLIAPLPDAPAGGLAPAWSSAYLAPVETRSSLEEGNAALVGPDFAIPLPAAEPGAMDRPPGTVVDPAVLAERRARRAEQAEESASSRVTSAEQTVETLRAQLAHLEERASRAGEERDSLAARVSDAEGRLRLAEQREEAERRRRAELEEQVAGTRHGVEGELEDLRARLADARELAETLERELDHVRRRADDAARTAEAERAARAASEEAAARATAEAESLRARAASADVLREELESLRASAIAAGGDELRAEVEELRAEAESLRARAAEAEALRAEAESLRARAAEADALRAEAESLRARAAEAEALRAEARSLRARADEAESLRDEAEALRLRAAEAVSLRIQAESLRAEVDALRAETDALRARAASTDDLRAHIGELERRLAADPRRAGAEALRARAAELERQLGEERLARQEAEAAGPPAASERERALAAQVAALEAELARRAAVQARVHEAISLIREELAEVRRQVEGAQPLRAADAAAITDLRADLVELEERARALEASARARGEELDAAREELARERAESERRREALAAAEQSAAEARRVAAELRDRLAAEQAARAAAEERLAQQGAQAAEGVPRDLRPTGDPALDTLIAGLREQVASAREQLARWGAPQPEAAATPAPSETAAASTADAPPPTELSPWEHEPPALDEPLPPKRAGTAAGTPPQPTPPDEQPPEEPPRAGGTGPSDQAPATAPLATGDETRRRLQSIAAELRAAVPEEGGARGARDVIGDLQRAAERLRAAAEQELERLEDADAPPAAAAPPSSPLQAGERELARLERAASQDVGDEAPGAGAEAQGGGAGAGAGADADAAVQAEPPGTPGRPGGVPLAARTIVPAARELPWLRTAIERLAPREADTAARVLAALLPVQALAVDGLTYDLTAPAAGTLRVTLAGGAARVEPRDRPGERHEIDVAVEGPVGILAPLAAGGAGWRLKGAQVRGSRLKLRRLLKARREPVGLADLGRAGSPMHPGLLLAALAAAVEPAWTRGHRFAVAYVIGGDGTWTVLSADGEPLRVLPETPDYAGGPSAIVTLGAPAFMPVIAGEAPPAGETAEVAGDRRAVDLLHGWFDAARGVAPR
jgi:hypothetical protein